MMLHSGESACMLVASLGNTHVRFAWADADGVLRDAGVAGVAAWQEDAVDLAAMLREGGGTGSGGCEAFYCSTVPRLNGAWERVVEEALGVRPQIITHRHKLGIGLDYPEPERLGTDRLVNAAWAAHAYGAPVIVCDCGTCVTTDLVLPDSGFCGGIIQPGLRLFADYLHERAEQLPAFDPDCGVPPIPGRSTLEAMQLGAWVGWPAMVRAGFAVLLAHTGLECKVCVTGGDAAQVNAGDLECDPLLTLRGVALVGSLNNEG